jgi:hypothetical protein
VAEVQRLAAEALGVPAGAKAALRLGTRELRGEETLAEAGVGAGGAEELWLAVGVAGGMMAMAVVEAGGVSEAPEARPLVAGLFSGEDSAALQALADAAASPATGQVMLSIPWPCDRLDA